MLKPSTLSLRWSDDDACKQAIGGAIGESPGRGLPRARVLVPYDIRRPTARQAVEVRLAGVNAAVGVEEIDGERGRGWKFDVDSDRQLRFERAGDPQRWSVLKTRMEFKRRPASGFVDFELALPAGSRMCFQPPLSECEEGCQRPDHIVNSYAVYIGHLKLAHLFRSYVYDLADPSKLAWAESEWLEHDGILRTVLPAGWNRDFGLDPTLGYYNGGTPGGTMSSKYSAGWCFAVGGGTPASPHGYQAAENGTVDSVSIYCDPENASTDFTLGVYDENAGAPNSRICDTAERGGSVENIADWYTLNRDSGTGTLTNGSYYWPAEHHGGSGQYYFYDVTTGCRYASNATGYSAGDIPASGPGTKSGSELAYSFYLTYTAAGGGGNPYYYYQQAG